MWVKVNRVESSAIRILRVHRWVLWWFYVGVACGVAALGNILFGHLTRTEERVLLIVGLVHWILGGFVCWALEGIRMEKTAKPAPRNRIVSAEKREWHAPSDFLFPGRGRTLLPPSRDQQIRETLQIHRIEHSGQPRDF